MNALKPAPATAVDAKVGAGNTVAASPKPVETGVDNLLSLLQRELVAPLSRVAELATRLEELRASGYLPNTLAGEQAFAELATLSRRSADTAARFIDLGDLLVGAPILADEHILIASSLSKAAADLSETAAGRSVGIRLADSHHHLAPVYGSARWLTLALRRLVGQLVEAAPAGAHVLARLRQVGFHQLLTADINHNPPAPVTLNLVRKDAGFSVKDRLAAAGDVETLDLALAQAVIELHGGTLKTDVTENGVLHQFTLTLPTGEPQALRRRPDCANCPSMHQAEQFAKDIGELLNAMQTKQQKTSTGSHK